MTRKAGEMCDQGCPDSENHCIEAALNTSISCERLCDGTQTIDFYNTAQTERLQSNSYKMSQSALQENVFPNTGKTLCLTKKVRVKQR